MNKLGILFWIGVFFLWIIYLRMQKDEQHVAKHKHNKTQDNSKI